MKYFLFPTRLTNGRQTLDLSGEDLHFGLDFS